MGIRGVFPDEDDLVKINACSEKKENALGDVHYSLHRSTKGYTTYAVQ